MKKIGEYTVRGQLSSLNTEGERIQLFDGRFDTAYKVVKFWVSAQDPTDNNNDCVGTLGTEPHLPHGSTLWNWSDNRQIAWASSNSSTGTMETPNGGLVDPDNLIVEDLYVYGRYDNSGETDPMNYMIIMEKYDITDSLGVLTMIRNRSQGETTE